MATESLSLLEFLRELVTNTQLRDWFAHDPRAALTHYGLDDLSPDDVHDALVLAEDNQTADFSLDHAGGHHVSWTPPPVPHDASPHEAAVQYLNSYVTSNHVDFDQDVDDTTAFGTGDPTATPMGVDVDGGAFASGGGAGVDDPDGWHDVNPWADPYSDHGDHGVDHLGHVDAGTHDVEDSHDPTIEHH